MEKFEVRDKVKIVRMDTRWYNYVSDLKKYLSVTGIVKESSPKQVHVAFDDGDSWWFDPDWLELVEKKQKGWTGKVVCTEVHNPCGIFFEIGKVYEVKNGLLIDRTGTPYDNLHTYNSAADLIKHFEEHSNYYRFVEFKGFCKNGKE